MTDNIVAMEEYQSRPLAAPGVTALAELNDEEFERRLTAMKKHIARVKQMQLAIMEEGVDYGVLPGISKPTLYKPGAEKLCEAYQLRSDFAHERHGGDGATSPNVAYTVRCELHLGSLSGPIVGVGHGAANSWETKHRYRRGQRTCPSCGAIGTIIKSSFRPEWLCYEKKGGCKATFRLGDPAIEQQQVGDVENPDPWDLENTILKMAEKRAFVDVTLRATASSGIFTQDVEDELPPTPPPNVDAATGEIVEPRVIGTHSNAKVVEAPQGPAPLTEAEQAAAEARDHGSYAAQTCAQASVKALAWFHVTVRKKWGLEHKQVCDLMGVTSLSKEQPDMTLGTVLDFIADAMEKKSDDRLAQAARKMLGQ